MSRVTGRTPLRRRDDSDEGQGATCSERRSGGQRGGERKAEAVEGGRSAGLTADDAAASLSLSLCAAPLQCESLFDLQCPLNLFPLALRLLLCAISPSSNKTTCGRRRAQVGKKVEECSMGAVGVAKALEMIGCTIPLSALTDARSSVKEKKKNGENGTEKGPFLSKHWVQIRISLHQ